jgi:hypothetical protein
MVGGIVGKHDERAAHEPGNAVRVAAGSTSIRRVGVLKETSE